MNNYQEYYENLNDDFNQREFSNILTKDLSEACMVGNLNKVKYLLVSSQTTKDEEFKTAVNKINLYKHIDQCLILACGNGHLELVRFLLTSPDLKKKPNIQPIDRPPLSFAAGNGHLEVVKYLLTSPDLKQHANIHANNEDAIKNACVDGHIDIVKYLMGSPELKTHPIIQNNEKLMRVCFKKSMENSGKMDIIHYFIFDCNIERTQYINELLQEHPNEMIENWFKIRELNHNLEKQLASNKIINSDFKKVKI